MFQACIHRGAHEIGGSCVELACDGQRLVLDLGLPLDAALDDDVPLPAIAGLAEGDPSLLGLVITHGHPDHYGLATRAHPDLPVYVGKATSRILAEATFFTPMGATFRPRGFLVDRQPLELGPFQMTPFLVDHSAFDAYAVLVEAGDRRLLYSGDLRAHGRKASVFERLLAEPPTVDSLLLEGTRVSDDGRRIGAADEREVEERTVELCRATSGLVLALYSPQNLDRLVSVYRAAKRTGRLFVVDLYAASIIAATGRATLPQPSWEDVRVFVPRSQRVRVKREEAFERVAAVRQARLYPEQLAERAGQLLLTFRASMAAELEQAGCLDDAAALWSMWPGYLEQQSGVELRRWLDEKGIPLTITHASGHATAADLQRLVAALKPERVIPIHTAAPERYESLFPCVERHDDGEWWPV
jgi:ribonuclease J